MRHYVHSNSTRSNRRYARSAEIATCSKDQVRTYARTCGMDVPRFTDDELRAQGRTARDDPPGNMSFAMIRGW